jgi:hypothetical protein
MRSRRLLLSSFAIVVLGGVSGCGDSKGDRPAPASPATPTSTPTPAAAPTQWTDPKDLLKALRAALMAGETARVVGLYDASDPDAAVKKRFWGALAESFPIEGRIQTAYVKKFGQAAWDADANSAKWGTGGDFGLISSFLQLNDARVDEEDGTARVGIDKFVFRVVRRDGKCVAFREETFGRNDDEVRIVVDDIARAKKILAAVDTSSDAATFEKRFAAIRAQ